jgi:hypothetical protein
MENFNLDQLNDFEEREKHYKEKIEQLENDLNKERNIYDIDNKNSEIISNIKNEILSKEKEIQEMTDKNNKQKEQLILISHEIDKKLKKLSDTTQIVQIKKKENSLNFDDDIKVKEKQISNINNLIDILQMENDKLKMKIDFISYNNNGNNKEKFKLIELDKKILSLNQEIKQKKLIIQEHNKCLSIKNQILKKISLIQKEISGEKEKNIKIKKKLSSTESKYILIKQDYENKFKNQFNSTIFKNSKKILKNNDVVQNYFNQNELNAIFVAVGGNKTIFSNILKRLNINASGIENNKTKILENQIEVFQKKQKINIIKNNQLIEEINDVEKNNNNKDIKINKLKIELENLKKEYNEKINNNNITENSDDLDKENIDKITSKKMNSNSNFMRIQIDANKNKEDKEDNS